MGAFSTRMRFVLLSTHKQPLENQPLPGSFSQLVQIGRWWQNLWACGRTFRRGTRRSCSFQFQHLCSLQLPQEPVLTISTGFFDRTHTDPLRPQLVTCCRWCTRILSAGHTPFRHTPVWAEWRRSCSRLLLTCSPQRELLSRFMSALSTATGQWSLDKKVLWSSLSKHLKSDFDRTTVGEYALFFKLEIYCVLSDTSLPWTCLSWAVSAPQSGPSTRTGTPSWWRSLDTGWSWRASSTWEPRQRYKKNPTKIKWIMHEMIKRILSRAFHLKMCQIWQFSGPSDLSGASAAPWTGRRGGSETGLSGKAACSTREVAYWEEHWVSVNEIISEIRQLQTWFVVLQ